MCGKTNVALSPPPPLLQLFKKLHKFHSLCHFKLTISIFYRAGVSFKDKRYDYLKLSTLFIDDISMNSDYIVLFTSIH